MTEVVRRCTGGDMPRLMELFRQVYRYNPRMQERDYLAWQFRGGAFREGDEYNIWLAVEGDRIKSFLGYVPADLYYQGEVIPCCWPQNWACLSGDYAGLTVLGKVMEEYDHLLYAALAADTVKIFSRLQIPILMEMPRWLGIVTADKIADLFDLKSPEDKKKIADSQSRLLSLPPSAAVHRVARFEPDEEFTFDRWPEIIGYSRRTGRYLNWRYFEIPRHTYQALQNDQGQFAVYRIETIKDHTEAVVRILEWSFSGAAAVAAMQMVVENAKEHNAILIDFFCTAEVVGTELEKVGFLRENQIEDQIPYLFRPIKGGVPGISAAIDLPPHRAKREVDFTQWYITRGDTDIDRIKL